MSKLCGLNVVQLREELQKRSLVTSGNKEVLVARQIEALIDEGKNPDEFKFDGADEDNEISTGTFTTAKMMELLLSMSIEIKQIKEQSERQSERQTEEFKQQSERQTEELKQQIKEQSERQTEEFKKVKDQLKHVKLEVAEQIEEQSTRLEMIEQKLDRQTVEVDHEIDKLKRELEQSKKMTMPLDQASGRTLKVPAFDGEMPWNVYKTQFEAAATSNCWNGKERATALILALRGSAAEVLQTIPAENHFNYEVLQLAQDIERLTLLSYPTSDPEHRDETALDTFIKSLRDSELKQSLLLSDKRKLKDAVAQSLTFESAKSDVRLRQVHEECSCQKVIVKCEPQQHGVPQCWICGEKGHLRRDCKHRQKDNYCRNCATRWRKRRKDDPVSRSAPSNEEAEKLIRANFVGQRLASRIDAPSTVINVSRLHRNRNDLWLNGKLPIARLFVYEHVVCMFEGWKNVKRLTQYLHKLSTQPPIDESVECEWNVDGCSLNFVAPSERPMNATTCSMFVCYIDVNYVGYVRTRCHRATS
ncbi:hypothetical protein HELRODRAFT_166051 [Helobdella robusta]|uniref:CCHC-type domain-containing protein n=1 Tax=Helobdella robusta TaxID=6412 RepID=T1EXM9_HELRO|nr:hypothetical protein HELRODRAFT_166051 [Helobdella robusta]ESN90386.1 hypothetical protein HELRODRAFT_166051 [Helobdella robusta]